MTRKRLSPKKFPTKTNSGKSGSKKLAEFKKKAAARASPGESPSQYRQKVERERASTPTPTQKTTIAEQLMPGVKSPHLLEKFIRQNKPPSQIQVSNLFPGITKKDMIKDFATSKKAYVSPKLTQAEINKIRSVHAKLPDFAGLPMSASIVAALKQDLQFRNYRIDTREKYIDSLNNQANLELTRLNKYNQYIKNGAFVGTDAQYKAYQEQYKAYKSAANNYNRNVQAHNIDVKEYNKNLKNLKTKTRPAAPIAKTIAAYKSASSYVSKKLPTPEQAKPAIKFILENAPGPSAYKILNATPQTRKYAQQIVDFNVGAYGAVKQKPLKAAATFATFAIGGAVIKGLGTAAKALGAGAKTAKAAKLIEGGFAAVYVTSTGRRYMLAGDAREAGFVTGDVIFNELLPAGLGLKYGVKVVSKLPSGVKKLKGTGTKTKAGLKEFAKAESAEVIFKKKPTKTQFEAEFNRLYNKAAKDAKKQAGRDLTRTELKNLKDSIRRSKKQQIEELATQSVKAKARKEDTLAKQISQQFQKERVQKAKVEFEKKTDTLKGAAKEPTVTNITRQSKNLVKKAIRLQEKYDRGQISKATYEKQKADIFKTAKEIESLKKYAIEVGVDAKVSQSPKSITDAISQTKQITSAKKNTMMRVGKASKINISPAAALGAFTIPDVLVNAISTSLVAKKPLPKAKINAFVATKPTATTLGRLGKTKPAIKKTPVKKTPTKKKTPRKPTTTKVKEKAPEVIPPKTPTKKKTTRKRKTIKKSRTSTTRQRNVNAVATFKDLLK